MELFVYPQRQTRTCFPFRVEFHDRESISISKIELNYYLEFLLSTISANREILDSMYAA